MPLTWVPTVTDVTGSMVPVAVMEFWMLVIVAFSVWKVTTLFSFLPVSSQMAMPTTTRANRMNHVFFDIFFIYIIILLSFE